MTFSRICCAFALGLCLSLQTTFASAQVWDAQRMLERISSARIQLTTQKGNETVTVDTIDRVWVERAVSVTARIAPSLGIAVPPVYVTAGKSPNAYVTQDREQNRPIMALNIAMLKMVGDYEDQLAAVIGHELGHLKADHLNDKGKQTAALLLGVLAGAVLDVNAARRGIDTGAAGMQLGMVGGQLGAAKFNRDQEREADDLGIRAMANAGFDPSGSARLWARMESLGGGRGGFWMDTHPSSEERRQTLQAAAVQLAPLAAQRQREALLAWASMPRVADSSPVSPYLSLALTAEEASTETPNAYRRGLDAHKVDRTEDAVAAWWEAAQRNDPRAYVQLAGIYLTGKGVEKNVTLACQYMEQSAALGFTPAFQSFGEMTLSGTCAKGGSAEAVRLLTIAHQRGWTGATARLGMMHATGNGVTRDIGKGRAFAQVAAERGEPLGKSLYGAMLRDGAGGTADPARGTALLKEAVDLAPGLGFAQYQLAVSYEGGIGVDTDKTMAIAGYRRALGAGVTGARAKLQALGADE
jgi:Zn-dependent protease with chaperone function